MSHAIWLNRDEGLRAVAAAKSKYQRDLVMGTIAWGEAPTGTRGSTALESYRASCRSLRATLNRLRVETSLHIGLLDAEPRLPTIYEGETLDEAAMRGRGTARPPRAFTESLVIGSISPGFVDDADKNGRRLAASLVLACAGPGGRGSTEPPDELVDWFREQRDVESMFAAIDGAPRVRCTRCNDSGREPFPGFAVGPPWVPCSACSHGKPWTLGDELSP